MTASTGPFHQVLLLLANALIPVAILTFATGFFPYKPFLPGLAQYGETGGYGEVPAPPFDKVVFMVVDALRSDFVYGPASAFSFTQSLITEGAALPFTAHATSPTITMPRVKAITTGSIPSFLDVILNFAESDTTSNLAHQDTWLAQMKAKGTGKLVMYGDDTWLKLFPETFARADGTSSFFVSDFTEVDNNVTRHIPRELENDDWNTMIMHYLGLDHIGHKTGPKSPHMIPKQREMDDMVQTIYAALGAQAHLHSTLLVLCGDHGMNDAGNHGGSAPGETSPALVFISPKLKTITKGKPCPAPEEPDYRYYDFVEQSDVAPTLAGLLGFPVPLNNLGVFIPSLLRFWEGRDRLQLLVRNAVQILEIVRATFPHADFGGPPRLSDCSTASSDVDELACMWQQASRARQEVKEGNYESTLEASRSFTTFSKRAQEVMSSTASNYNVPRLHWGIGIASVSAAVALVLSVSTIRGSIMTWLVLTAICLSYGGMMFASSYVEEEQHYWYWVASGWLAYISLKESRFRAAALGVTSVGILLGLRVTRRWNQTGQKFAGEPDIAKAFLPAHNYIMWTAVVAAYLDILQRLTRRGFPRAPPQVAIVISVTLCLAAFSFKAAFTRADAPELLRDLPQLLRDGLPSPPLIVQARTVFLGLATALGYAVFSHLWPTAAKGEEGKGIEGGLGWLLHDLLSLLLLTQTRVTNIPLFLLFEVQLNFLTSLDLSATDISITSLVFQYLSFFALGGSNAISSVDLSNAYNGVGGYDVVAVGVLTFVGNWAGPIWWTSAATLLLLRRAKREPAVWGRHLALQTLFTTSSLVSVMAACAALRSHLFIWTVFSPKYLFSMAWCLAQHLGVNVVGGSILFWAGRA